MQQFFPSCFHYITKRTILKTIFTPILTLLIFQIISNVLWFLRCYFLYTQKFSLAHNKTFFRAQYTASPHKQSMSIFRTQDMFISHTQGMLIFTRKYPYISPILNILFACGQLLICKTIRSNFRILYRNSMFSKYHHFPYTVSYFRLTYAIKSHTFF